jgi:tRNA pseudouridine38-40 synthase
MRNLSLLLSYLGSSFVGWQKTSSGMSIEEALETALARILRETPKLQAASRTDAGVHAEGQLVNFLTEKQIELSLLKRALNGTLPKEISVLAIEERPLDFHPTLDCIKKEYRYLICHGGVQLPFHRYLCWHYPYPLAIEAMKKGAASLLGTHDYSAFCNERASYERSPICHLEEISFSSSSTQLCVCIIGDRFLYKMVRNIIGTLVYVGCGKMRAEDVPSILQSGQRVRAGITAPAHGLSLYKVYYKS